MPSLAQIIGLRLAPASTSCRAVRPSKSDAFRRLRRPGLTLLSYRPVLVGVYAVLAGRGLYANVRESQELWVFFGGVFGGCRRYSPVAEHSLAALGNTHEASLCIRLPSPCRAIRPSRSFASCRLRRTGDCILDRSACLPWRDFMGFDWPQPCHPWQVVRPSKSVAFRRLRRPGLTHTQVLVVLLLTGSGRSSTRLGRR